MIPIIERCTRCGIEAERLYTIPLKNDDDEIINHRLCWSCDFDYINGGDIDADPSDIYEDRLEEQHAYDPINY